MNVWQRRNEMTDEKAIGKTDTAIVPVMPITMPGMTVAQATQRYDQMVQFVKDIMHEGIDYGRIPGTSKPTLLKPGAEKLTTFFGLRTIFILRNKLEDWDAGRFNYIYACQLWRDDVLIAETEASANSMEKRYRWRYVSVNKATEDEKQRAVRTEARQGKYGPYEVYVVENDDPYTLVNTLQKMAQKRALVGSTLIAVNASEFFTQDLEDMGGFTEPDAEPEQDRATAQPQETKANGKTKRPAMPTTVQKWLLKKARDYRKEGITGMPSKGQMGLMAGKLAEAHKDGAQARHLFLEYVFGKASSTQLAKAEVRAVRDWLISHQDAHTNDYILDDNAVAEMALIVREQLLAHGQTILPEEA